MQLEKNEFFITRHQTHKLKMPSLGKYCVHTNILILKVNKNKLWDDKRRLGLQKNMNFLERIFVENWNLTDIKIALYVSLFDIVLTLRLK